MEGQGNTWKQHGLAVFFRLACMAVIAMAGPLMAGGAELPDGSERAPGVAGMLFVVGLVAAVIFALCASTAHYFLRQRPLKLILIADALLASGFIALMAYNGAKAKAQPAPGAKRIAQLPHRVAVCS